ncbi:MAG: tetratricopeptide repeat protein [Isosphaeraceae bacterium]
MRHPGESGQASFTWIAAALVVLTALPFLPVLHNGFVNWDDQLNFESNTAYRGLGWGNIHWAWTTFHVGVYQPFAWMLFGLQYLVFELRPWGYHATSLLLHTMVTAALFGLFVALLRRTRITHDQRTIALAAALASLLWAVHPLRVEVVAWVSCQGYLPGTLLSVLSVWAYLLARREGIASRRRWLVCSLALYTGSLLCKPISLGLPVVLMILDFYPLGRIQDPRGLRTGIREKWPFFLVAIMFVGISLASKREAMPPSYHLGNSARFAQAAYAVWFYLVKTVLPIRLQVHYAVPHDMSLGQPIFLAASLGLLVVLCLTISVWKQWPAFPTLILSYLALLAPTPGLVSFGTQLAADRYAYLALLPWTFLLAHLLAGLVAAHRTWVLAIGIALVATCSVLTWRQCLTWHDSVSLWTHALEVGNPEDPVVLGSLGQGLLTAGQLREGQDFLIRSLQYEPDWAPGHYNLGTCYHTQGRLREAVEHYARAVQLKPEFVEARQNLAQVFMQIGKAKLASEQLEAAILLQPNSAALRRDYGHSLAELGDFLAAAVQLDRAVRLDPAEPRNRMALGRVLAELGRFSEAAEQLTEAVRRAPDNPAARRDLGIVLADLGRRDEAVKQLRKSLELRPGDRMALSELERISGAARGAVSKP